MPSELARLLKQRGHEVTCESSSRDILLPPPRDAAILKAFEELLYASLRRDGLRKSWRNWAYDGHALNEDHQRQIDAYVTLCMAYGASDDIIQHKRQRYAKTFEWYISELLRREFAARASGFGIRLKDAHPDDEFDCIAVIDRGVVYVECKTGQGQVFDDLEKISRRDQELRADYTLYIFDRDYAFQGSTEDLPSLSDDRARALGIKKIERITSPNGDCKFISFYGSERHFFVCTTSDLERQIRHAIRYYNALTEGGFFFSGKLPKSYNHMAIPFTDTIVGDA